MMTLQQSLEAMAAAAAGVVLDGILALACLHFHLNLATAFWLAMLLVSLASLGDAVRKRRTILRGSSIPLPPERRKDFNLALSTTTDIFWGGLMIRQVLLILHWMSHKSMHAILASLGRHIAFTAFTAIIFFLFTSGIIYLYWLRAKRKGFVWSRQPNGEGSDPSCQDFDLPPLTAASLRQPAIGAFWVVSLVSPFCESWYLQPLVQHFSLHLLLVNLTLSAAIAVGAVLIYVALVAFLTSLNNRRARLRARLVAFADETTWPPPPTEGVQ